MARRICVWQDIVFILLQIFCEQNSRNIHEFADYAKAICDRQDTCCIYQRGKRVIVQNMVAISDDLIFAISIQFATFGGVQDYAFTIYSLFIRVIWVGIRGERVEVLSFGDPLVIMVQLVWIFYRERNWASNEFKLIGEIFSSAFIICNMEVATFSNLKWKAFDGAHHSSLMRHITDAGAWSGWLFM